MAILDPLPDVSVSDYFVFPELRTLNFDNVQQWTDEHSVAFRYFSQNSPKLEEILIHITGDLNSMQIVCDSIAKSIGPLVSRTALRTLAIRIRKIRYYYHMVSQSFIKLIKCPVEKPKLERLILSPLIPLSTIYEFVNENWNLKSLTIDMKIDSRSREETIDDLIRIFDCNNGLDEIDLGGLTLPHEDRLKTRNGDTNGKIYRDEFPRMISRLKDPNCWNEITQMRPHEFVDMFLYVDELNAEERYHDLSPSLDIY